MKPLLTAAEMRSLDDRTIREVGLPGCVLMETAGRGVFSRLWATFEPQARQGPTIVVCGRGNNGGDGFVVARCLHTRGCDVLVLLLGRCEEVPGDAAIHLTAYRGVGGRVSEVTEMACSDAAARVAGAGLVVDAIVGTGLSEDLRGLALEAVGWVNGSRAPVVSVDLPSGVDSDTGRLCGAAVQADLTVTFGWAKRGHWLYPGASRSGRLEVVDIGIPEALLARQALGLLALEPDDVSGWLARAPDAHKGTFGHVFILGGGAGKEGAAILAASAALRAGAGLSTLCWPADLFAGAGGRIPPEVMTVPLPAPGDRAVQWGAELWPTVQRLQETADAWVVGPGMGAGDGLDDFLGAVFSEGGPPLVVDADALNALAVSPGLWPPGARRAVLTPHPGEAARLLGVTTGEVQADRVGAVRELADRWGAVAVLKGARTLVTAPDAPVALVPTGNAGMATAGSGDVLSGAVAAFLARGLPALDAAKLAAFAHGLAGDLAAEEVGMTGLTAAHLLRFLPKALKTLGG
ncbi:MAG: NAD(P)H-hydrate dehydratase [Deltaproteobacteria bacterium]|nr:NAD(P)H-hydrate dehydratase [Deltaproteobacteria bacterium]